MAEVNFSGKLAKTIQIGDLKIDDANAKQEVLEAIFGKDAVKDKKITIDELTAAVGRIDTNKDGKIDDAEIKAAVDTYNSGVASDKQIQQADYVAHLKAMAQKNIDDAKDDNIGNGYTVQLGEQVNDLVERVLASQGVAKGSDGYQDKFNKCKQAIIDNNPQAFNKDKGWLIAGAKIYLPTDTTTNKAKKDVKDLDNKSEVEDLYRRWTNHEFGNFAYHVDAQGNRSGASGVSYTKVGGGRSSGSAADGGTTIADKVAAINLQDVVDLEKIPEGEARDFTEMALNRLDWMKDDEKISNITNNSDANPPYLSFSVIGDENQGSVYVEAYYDENKNITKYKLSMYGNVESTITLEKTGKLTFNRNNQETVANYGVDSDKFNLVEQLIKSSSKIREAMDLPSYDIVDETQITTRDIGDNDRDEVMDKIHNANAVIYALETGVKKVGDPVDEGDKKKIRVEMKDGSFVDVLYTSDKKIEGVYVVLAGNTAGKVDVAYGREDNAIAVNTDFDNSEYEVVSKGAVKNFDEIVKFVLSNSDVKAKIGIANATQSDLPYNINYYMTNGKELGRRLYDQVKGSSRASTTRTVMSPTSKRNIVGVIEQFNSMGDMKILKYLDSESGVTAFDIQYNIIGPVMHCAADYGLKDTNEYADLKYFYDKYVTMGKKDVDDPNFAERADSALVALKDKIKAVANERGAKYSVGEITAPENMIRSKKSDGEDVGHRLYDQVDGWSDSDNTRSVLQEITKENIYYVIQQFNIESPNRNIIKYLVSENNVYYKNLTLVLANALDCATEYGLFNTEEYLAVQAYQDYCFNNTEDPDDEDWASRVDSALKTLMTKVKAQAATRGESL